MTVQTIATASQIPWRRPKQKIGDDLGVFTNLTMESECTAEETDNPRCYSKVSAESVGYRSCLPRDAVKTMQIVISLGSLYKSSVIVLQS